MQSFFRNPFTVFPFLLLVCAAVAVASLFVGRYHVAWADFYGLLASVFDPSADIPPQTQTVVVNIRLPRILAAFLVGGTLSLTGAAYQGMFRNPMVSPSILGVSAGAGFGAALAILLALGAFWVQTFAFVFGITAVVTVYLIGLATGEKYNKSLTLILSGMVVSTVFTALVSMLKYVADPYDALPSIVYWLMGGLSQIEMADLGYVSIIAMVGLTVLTLSGWKLDILSFGDEEAKTMGIHVDRLRILVIGTATLMTAAAVSISGIIGWVGLLVPHIVRMVVGPSNRMLLPASFLTGGAFLMVVDDFSRSITSLEIPLGITTSLIGAPFFIFMMMKTSKKLNQ
ncbi:MAG: iron ABC transporter permease [Breznakibacter sp.]